MKRAKYREQNFGPAFLVPSWFHKGKEGPESELEQKPYSMQLLCERKAENSRKRAYKTAVSEHK